MRRRGGPDPMDSMARRYWKATVTRGGCVMCRAYPEVFDPSLRPDLRTIQGHHIIAKRHLKREGFGHRLWDVRNGLGLCRLHHARHEHWAQRVPMELVPDGAVEFAIELGLDYLLDLEYRSAAA